MKKSNVKQVKLSIWIPVIVAIVSGVFLLTGNWQKSKLDNVQSVSSPTNATPPKEDVHIKDNQVSGGLVIGNINAEGSITINQNNESQHENRRTETVTSTSSIFRIVSSSDFKAIIDLIPKSNNWTYSNQAKTNIFEITFTGNIEKAEESNLFLFRGGSLAIKKDGQICKVLDGIKLEALDYPPNPKSILEERIQQQIKLLAKQNAKTVAQEITKCLL